MTLVLILAAIVCFLWYAVIAAGWATFGTAGVLLGVGLACFAAAQLPWPWDRPVR